MSGGSSGAGRSAARSPPPGPSRSLSAIDARAVDRRAGLSYARAVRRVLGTLVVIAALAAPASAAAKSCADVSDPYPGTRYEGVDLTRITATGVTCTTARRVARGAHRRALGLPVPDGPVRRFTWNGWRVTGDLRGSSDAYV